MGTGFSFTDDMHGFARDQDDIASTLFEALLQFSKVFPEMLQTDLYLAGESYACEC